MADLLKDVNGLTDLQAHSDLLKELRSYFNREIEITTYKQIAEQDCNAVSKGIYLNR